MGDINFPIFLSVLKYLLSWAWWCPPVIPTEGCWVWTSLGCTVILPTNHPPTLTLTVTLLCSLLWHLTFQLCVFGTCGISIAKTCNCLSVKTDFWTSADSRGVETYFKLHFIPAIIPFSLGAWFILLTKSYWSGNGSVNSHQLSTYSI